MPKLLRMRKNSQCRSFKQLEQPRSASVGATHNHPGVAATENERPAPNKAKNALLDVDLEVPGPEFESGKEQVELGERSEGLETEHSKGQEYHTG